MAVPQRDVRFPPKADITAAQTNVRFVPKADIRVMPRVLNSLGGQIGAQRYPD